MARRINVKGTSGSGKTTFAKELARRLELPYVELDALHHGPNWSEPTDEEFRARARRAMASPGWVIDGNYEAKLGETVLAEAETIVWLDLPLWLKLRRIWRRTQHRIRDDVELWSGNRESWRNALWGWDSLFSWMIRAHFRQKREWPRRHGSDPRFVRLRSVEEAKRWLQTQALAHRPRQEDDPAMQPGEGSPPEGTTTLGEYLIRLGEEPEELEKFLANRERAMRKAGLSREDRDRILEGNVFEIHEIVRQQFEDARVALIVHPLNWPHAVARIVHP
jgi:adenylate kinase family enzyme